MAGAGVSLVAVAEVLPNSKLLQVEGRFDSEDQLWAAIQLEHGNSDVNRKRWHLQDPMEDGETTWVLNNNWGTKTREFFAALLDLAPPGFAVHEEGASAAQEASNLAGDHMPLETDRMSLGDLTDRPRRTR